jgi:putative ABC transport system permease protein
MDTFIKDLRYGIRSFLKRPGFLVIAVSTLALGIGATTAMFTVVNSVLLRPQFPEPERVVLFEGVNPRLGIREGGWNSLPDIGDWKKQSQSFEHIATFATGGFFVTIGDEAVRVRATGVSPEFFPVFGNKPIHGRLFQPDDFQPGKEPVVISYALWQRRFGGATAVLNSTVMIGSESSMIVGIMPPGFNYPDETEMWWSRQFNPANEVRDNRWVRAIGRLKPNVPIVQAQAEMETISERLAQSYAETNGNWSIRLIELQERLLGNLRTSLLILLGAVAFVLLIACANVANLLLARAAYRQQEIAVRTALGASRLRVVRQLLTESVLLSTVSGLLGLALSIWLIKLLIAIAPPDTPRIEEIGIDRRVFAFTLGATLLAGLLFGLFPALQTSRPNLNEVLKDTGRRSETGSRNRVGGLLIVSEIALSFILLAGAGLLLKSFQNLRETSPGFNADNVLAMRLVLFWPKYKEAEPRIQAYKQVIESVKAIPGVQSAGAVLSLPLRGDSFELGRSVIREGRPRTPDEAVNARHLTVTGDYFQTLQIPLKSGRLFTDHDNSQSPKVVIISERMARELWPNENPIGRSLAIWRDEKFSREVVGVVGDTKVESLDKETENQMYIPYLQDSGWGSLTLVVRTTGDAGAFAGPVREAIRAVDKGIPTYNLKTLNDVVSVSVAPRRVPMLLLTSFAGVAMLLAMLGIYGVTSYYVTQRTHEIGVRMALGAQIGDVLKLVLRRAMLLAAIGIGIGIAGAFALTRYMTTLLFGVKPVDGITFVAVAVLLAAVVFVACLVPARRAAKIDPLQALR